MSVAPLMILFLNPESPIQTMWIDDELGLPLAYDGGPDTFATAFHSVDLGLQDEALFTGC